MPKVDAIKIVFEIAEERYVRLRQGPDRDDGRRHQTVRGVRRRERLPHDARRADVKTCKRGHDYEAGGCPFCRKASQARYEHSEKGRARRSRYNNSIKGRLRNERYEGTPTASIRKLRWENRNRPARDPLFGNQRDELDADLLETLVKGEEIRVAKGEEACVQYFHEIERTARASFNSYMDETLGELFKRLNPKQ